MTSSARRYMSLHARYRVYPETDTPPYRTHESERETETERESERQATRGRATRPGQPGAPVTRRAAARDTVLRIPQA
jgi:V8-like Glu-specific endopeptidase